MIRIFLTSLLTLSFAVAEHAPKELSTADDTRPRGPVRTSVFRASSPTVELMNLVMDACSEKVLRVARADGGRFGEVTVAYDLYQEGERSVVIQILRGGFLGRPSSEVGSLLIQRRPVDSSGPITEAPRKFTTSCKFITESENGRKGK